MALVILLANTGFLVHKFNTAPCSSTAGTEKPGVASRGDISAMREMDRRDF